jgi:fluoroacetyl-CoA thioesterase
LEPGSKLELSYKVQSNDLAKALSSDLQDDFPEVYATSRMIASMELISARLIKPLLSEGELSVGVNVNVTHMAATPNDVEVKGEAGRGTHTRAIVKTERLVQGAMNH